MIMKYFKFDEFFKSEVAIAVGINNVPEESQKQLVRGNIILLVDNVLDPIRESFKLPIIITSGYRCPALNDLIGGSESSQHLTGQAADFTVISLMARDLKKIAFWCSEYLDFDQMIVYSRQRFIHVSYVSKECNRNEVIFK